MKILYFILGNFSHDVEMWGINSFDDLLKEDIIFFGPIVEDKIEYKSKKYEMIKFFNEISVFELFKKLPNNWYPDIVHCTTSVLNYIPDIHKCPVRTCVYTGDAWADTIYNRKLVNFFDYTRYGIIDKEEYANEKTALLSTANSTVSIPEKSIKIKDFPERPIDVLAIANYNSGFYHERFKILFKTAQSLNTKYRIEYLINLKREEIHYYYQKSKIVLDWSHTPSNRSYEAALNGCLLFSYEKNKRVSEIWAPWEEYVPYGDDNLNTLIDFYLNNPDKSKIVIRNAQMKLNKIPYIRGKMILSQLQEAINTPSSISDRIERIEKMPRETYYHCLSTPFYYNYNYNTDFPLNWKDVYFERIDKALSFTSNSSSLLSILLDACRMSFVLRKYDKCMEYLRQLEEIKPSYAWIYYLKGRIQRSNGNFKDALHNFQYALEYAAKSPSEIKNHFLPYLEKNNVCDTRRIVDYIWHSILKHDNEYQVKALLHMTYDQMGDVSLILGMNGDALVFYQRAIQNLPISDCIYKLNDLHLQRNEYSSIVEVSEKGLQESPYDTRLVLDRATALLNIGNKQAYMKNLKNHRNALKSFKQSRRMKLRGIILHISFFLPVTGNYIAKVLSICINRLIKKHIPFLLSQH